MSGYWHIENSYHNSAFSAALPDLATAEENPGEKINGHADAACRVFIRDIDGTRYFIKHYRAQGFSWRQFLGASKVRTEWENLLRFRHLGISTPEPVAIGERRKLGFFDSGILVSEEIVGAIDLAALARKPNSLLHDPQWFARLCRELAIPLRRLHDTGFAHNDLNWRNVLLTLSPDLKVYFFDCPTGRRWFWPFRQFRLSKDLAHLDKMGQRYLSRTQRMRFFLTYAGHERLNAADKRLIRYVVKRSAG